MNGKEFFESYLSGKLTQNPGYLSQAGLSSKAVSLDLESAGQWTVCFDGSGHASIKNGLAAPDCTIQMSEKTFADMIAGSLNVPMAVVTRKIKIKGESSLAAKFGMALKGASKA
jgi:putative sterol carrier protein